MCLWLFLSVICALLRLSPIQYGHPSAAKAVHYV